MRKKFECDWVAESGCFARTRLAEQITKKGKEGWELVSITHEGDTYTAWLKREIV